MEMSLTLMSTLVGHAMPAAASNETPPDNAIVDADGNYLTDADGNHLIWSE